MRTEDALVLQLLSERPGEYFSVNSIARGCNIASETAEPVVLRLLGRGKLVRNELGGFGMPGKAKVATTNPLAIQEPSTKGTDSRPLTARERYYEHLFAETFTYAPDIESRMAASKTDWSGSDPERMRYELMMSGNPDAPQGKEREESFYGWAGVRAMLDYLRRW